LVKKKQSFARLKKKLDAVFSQWIRRRYATSQGLAVCVTCANVKPWKEQQCGHFVSRIYLATRWDERNCAVQCGACNVLRRGNYAEYSAYMLRKYGPEVIDELIVLKRRPIKLSAYDLEQMIETYNKKLETLDDPRRTGSEESPKETEAERSLAALVQIT
jgi:hypothetical protein